MGDNQEYASHLFVWSRVGLKSYLTDFMKCVHEYIAPCLDLRERLQRIPTTYSKVSIPGSSSIGIKDLPDPFF